MYANSVALHLDVIVSEVSFPHSYSRSSPWDKWRYKELYSLDQRTPRSPANCVLASITGLYVSDCERPARYICQRCQYIYIYIYIVFAITLIHEVFTPSFCISSLGIFPVCLVCYASKNGVVKRG